MKIIILPIRIIFGVLVTSAISLGLAQASSTSPTSGDYPSVWQCDNSKFNWYCEEQARQREEITAPRKIDIAQLKTSKEVREALEALKDRAVMMPTEENIKEYVAAQQYVFEKGAVFSDTWRRVVWANPELDYTLRRPVNNTAIRTYDQAQDQKELSYLKKLAKEHGLMFFFRSDCAYCHKMAPTLKQLGKQFGIEILPVSLDGPGLPDFPNPKINTGQAKALRVERVPALFIASRKTKDIAPVGYGVMSQTEIINRIFLLTNTKPGETF
ncbi:MAG: conjugal transfer protein TraF [Ottowia sp.]|nr:conjugal transfer protein TraF [Ottowia sp.]